ncbi:addiction module protein [Bacteroidota bacterium]
MEISLTLEKMTVEEKLIAIEKIWDDLCKNDSDIASPFWHHKVLLEREERINRGKDKFIDWDEAKNDIRNAIQ